MLVGINLSAYGSDSGQTLYNAVELACSFDGIKRVRLGSLEPDRMTEEFIVRLSTQAKLCPQFHISLQSGCDETLKRMNRHYTAAEYETLCKELRARFTDCTLTTDVMVGFPTESEDEFYESLEFVKKIGFEKEITRIFYENNFHRKTIDRTRSIDQTFTQKSRLFACFRH